MGHGISRYIQDDKSVTFLMWSWHGITGSRNMTGQLSKSEPWLWNDNNAKAWVFCRRCSGVRRCSIRRQPEASRVEYIKSRSLPVSWCENSRPMLSQHRSMALEMQRVHVPEKNPFPPFIYSQVKTGRSRWNRQVSLGRKIPYELISGQRLPTTRPIRI